MGRSSVLAGILLASSLTVTLDREPCDFDSAVLTAIPPGTTHVVAHWRCGGIGCFERYVFVNGKRVGFSSACEVEQGDKILPSGQPVPTSSNPYTP